MKRIKALIAKHIGFLSFFVSALVFLGVTWLKPHQPATLVPIINRFVAPGSRLQLHDVHWVPASAVKPAPFAQLHGYAKAPLYPGEIVSPAMLGNMSAKTVIVAVTPTNASDTTVALPGALVEVLVLTPKALLWHSDALPVVRGNSGNGGGASVDVTMPIAEAVHYEHLKAKGSVELVGLTS